MKITSSSFPPQLHPQVKSRFHLLINEGQIPQKKFNIRRFRNSDLNDLIDLQLQWFPLKYGKTFYNKICKNESECLVATSTIWIGQKQEEILVGAIVYERSDSRGYLQKQSYWEYFFNRQNSIYIMTIGVIQEFRKKGIAQLLLQQLVNEVQKNYQIKMIFLHVVVYNQIAIRFYKRNNFQLLQTIKDFYYINQKNYDSYAYAIFINNGVRSSSWKNWFKSKIGLI